MASIYSLSCRVFPQSFLLTITRGRVDKIKAVSAPQKKSLHYCGMDLSTQSHLNSCDLKAQIGPVRSSTSASSVPSLQKGPQAPLTSSSKKVNSKHCELSFRLETEVRTNCSRTLHKSGNWKNPKNCPAMV